MKLPPQTVHYRGWRSIPDHTEVWTEGREIICPVCAETVVRYLMPSEVEGKAWPEAIRHWDQTALAAHTCDE